MEVLIYRELCSNFWRMFEKPRFFRRETPGLIKRPLIQDDHNFVTSTF